MTDKDSFFFFRYDMYSIHRFFWFIFFFENHFKIRVDVNVHHFLLHAEQDLRHLLIY